MDSECCSSCGRILAYGEAGMCDDCWQDELTDEEWEYEDAWFYEDEEMGPEAEASV